MVTLGRRPAIRLLALISNEIRRQPADLRRHLAGQLESDLDYAITSRRVYASVGTFPLVNVEVDAIVEPTDDPRSN